LFVSAVAPLLLIFMRAKIWFHLPIFLLVTCPLEQVRTVMWAISQFPLGSTVPFSLLEIT